MAILFETQFCKSSERFAVEVPSGGVTLQLGGEISTHSNYHNFQILKIMFIATIIPKYV